MHSYGVYERAVGSGKHTDDQVTQMGIFWGNLCVFPDRMFFFICAIPPLWKERKGEVGSFGIGPDRIGSDRIRSDHDGSEESVGAIRFFLFILPILPT